jgi:arginine deiminase
MGMVLFQLFHSYMKKGYEFLQYLRLEESLELRNQFKDIDILMMGPILKADLKIASKHHIQITLYDLPIIKAVLNQDLPLTTHLKIDTGMSRYGLVDTEDILKAIHQLSIHPKIDLRGIYTHFATSSEQDALYERQLERFMNLLDLIPNKPKMIHISNSSSIFKREQMIKVHSEIGKLKSVLLHRPGKELENLTPDVLEKLLFDDIPYLKVAQEEHDIFANTLRAHGVEVLYLTDMLTEALEAHPEVVSNFINAFIEESKIKSQTIKNALYKYLVNLSITDMIHKMIEGIRTHEITVGKHKSIMDMLEDEYPFFTDPIPNILFQRDPFSSVGHGVAIGKMFTHARQRETIFAEYILTYHPRFHKNPPIKYYHRLNRYPLEGGDILVLNKNIIAIGISNRTDPRAIEFFAEQLFKENTDFKTVLAFNIPKSRAFMHLDTVFTQIDYGMFTIHPGIENKLTVFEITKNDTRFDVVKVVGSLEDVLEKAP